MEFVILKLILRHRDRSRVPSPISRSIRTSVPSQMSKKTNSAISEHNGRKGRSFARSEFQSEAYSSDCRAFARLLGFGSSGPPHRRRPTGHRTTNHGSGRSRRSSAGLGRLLRRLADRALLGPGDSQF